MHCFHLFDIYVYEWAHICVLGYVGSSEVNSWVFFFSFHQVGSRTLTEAIRLGRKLLYPGSHYAGPQMHICKEKNISFKRENILINIVNLGRWSNVFPEDGFAIRWFHDGRCHRALHISQGCNDRANAIINNTLPALLCKSCLC